MSQSELYDDPELYDLLFPSVEPFYLEQAPKRGGRVLELGCGTGRLTVSIAQRGIDIVGVDLSDSMLAAARNKARAAGVEVPFIHADMRDLDLDGRFETILIPGNSLLHLLTNEELKQCLAGVRRHLAPGGQLAFDISKWDMSRYARDPAQRYPAFTQGEISVDETSSYDPAAQVRDVVWYLSTVRAADFRRIEYRLRVIFPQELLLLLEIAGFHLEARYGEFTREPFEASSRRQVCICSA
jgi:SAM-dependent methyltransferase